MTVNELIEILSAFPDEHKEFSIIMTAEDEPNVSWSLDEASVSVQKNRLPEFGWCILASKEQHS